MSQAAVHDIDDIVRELTEGRGYVILERLFDADTLAEARPRIFECLAENAALDTPVDTNIYRAEDQVYNLVDKGQVFERMVQEPTILGVFSRILGSELKLGSFAARVVRRGSESQAVHFDYPYWSLYKDRSLPMNMNRSFFLNCQATMMVDDFTTENGATLVAPGSQAYDRRPTKDEFDRLCVQATGPAGSVMLMTGLLWHRAGDNYTDTPRVGILGQYLAKFVKPMEDVVRGLSPDLVERADPTLRALLGVDYPYPQVLDTARA